jgi:glycine oxidase
MNRKSDVLIVGGGVIGAACADYLAGQGMSVRLIDRGPLGRESSWAASGIVHPVHPWKYAEPLPTIFKLAMKEHAPLCRDLVHRTGIDPEFVKCGLVVLGEAADRVAAWWGDEAPWKRRADGGVFLPEACTIRAHLFTAALLEGARRRGADLLPHTPARRVEANVVDTPRGEFRAEFVILAAGTWSGQLRPEAPTRPVRGQILLYRGQIEHMTIFPGGEYAVPRQDGTVLFGSTLEHDEFRALPTRAAVKHLEEKAYEHLGFSGDALLAAWAGLRPGTPSDLPYICRRSSLIYATGHYRAGVILAPFTARVVSELIAGKAPQFALDLPN